MITRASLHRTAQALASALVVPLLLATVRAAPAEEALGAPVAARADTAGAEAEAARPYSVSAAVNIYVLSGHRTYAQPTLAGDYGRLHLEARYNYEALDTASAWLGFNFSLNRALSLHFTPMLGGVFGHTTGIAPGYKLTLAYWKLLFYSEGEYLFDTADSSGNFAYSWSELSLSPLEWLRFGFAEQRTRAYQTDVDIQRGPLIGVSYRWASVTAYLFDLDQSEQTYVVALAASF